VCLHRVDGAEEDALSLFKLPCRSKHQTSLAVFKVEAGLPDADIVIKGQDLNCRQSD
jgi:hypothetical protein